MTIKEIFSDFRFWIGAVVLIAGITIGVIKTKNIPQRIEAVEVMAVEAVDKVEKVADTVDMYMMEQRVIQVEQNKREGLMLDLIRATR